jgi:hypothetical protein
MHEAVVDTDSQDETANSINVRDLQHPDVLP